jgi:peptide/nickel transport system permease protein
MGQFLAKRILQGLLVIFLISIVTFVIMRLMPGDPVKLLLGDGQIRMTQEQMDRIRDTWGLNDPYHVQYFKWAGNFVTGNLGESLIRRGVPVSQMIFEALPYTLKLNGWSLLFALIIAIPAGIWAAVKRNSLYDYFVTIFTTAGAAIPNYWLGLMVIIVFSLWLRWFPPYGVNSWKGWVLPIAVLTFEQLAIFARVMRGSTVETLGQDYVRTAKAKGLGQRTVVTRHAARNALLPVVSIVGIYVATILSGTLVIETIFSIPGIGRLFVDSVNRTDYQVVQSIVVLLAVLVVVANIVTDVVYSFVDPRIRLK